MERKTERKPESETESDKERERESEIEKRQLRERECEESTVKERYTRVEKHDGRARERGIVRVQGSGAGSAGKGNTKGDCDKCSHPRTSWKIIKHLNILTSYYITYSAGGGSAFPPRTAHALVLFAPLHMLRACTAVGAEKLVECAVIMKFKSGVLIIVHECHVTPMSHGTHMSHRTHLSHATHTSHGS